MNDSRWAFVASRDRTADGTFYYSVKTTGVYCRPSCGARRPNQANVAFHNTAEEAERAGFRPCLRCKPGGPALEERYAKIVAATCRLIEAVPRMPNLTELARQAGLSPHHFHRIFKTVTGVTPRAYAVAERSRRLRRGLDERN